MSNLLKKNAKSHQYQNSTINDDFSFFVNWVGSSLKSATDYISSIDVYKIVETVEKGVAVVASLGSMKAVFDINKKIALVTSAQSALEAARLDFDQVDNLAKIASSKNFVFGEISSVTIWLCPKYGFSYAPWRRDIFEHSEEFCNAFNELGNSKYSLFQEKEKEYLAAVADASFKNIAFTGAVGIFSLMLAGVIVYDKYYEAEKLHAGMSYIFLGGAYDDAVFVLEKAYDLSAGVVNSLVKGCIWFGDLVYNSEITGANDFLIDGAMGGNDFCAAEGYFEDGGERAGVCDYQFSTSNNEIDLHVELAGQKTQSDLM